MRRQLLSFPATLLSLRRFLKPFLFSIPSLQDVGSSAIYSALRPAGARTGNAAPSLTWSHVSRGFHSHRPRSWPKPADVVVPSDSDAVDCFNDLKPWAEKGAFLQNITDKSCTGVMSL